MHYELLAPDRQFSEASHTVLSICQTGILESTIIQPSKTGSLPPLLALHGISRNASEMVRAFSPVAEEAGRIVIVPHFTADQWPVFQRISRKARPDRALIALLQTLRGLDPVFDTPIDLFGFSGGAQLAHRFAMLYPEAVGSLHLGAAGWYTFPDSGTAYPYGLGGSAAKDARWAQLMQSGLRAYLQRSFHIYVGANDTSRDQSLRSNALVDQQQGRHRVERAERFVAAIRSAQLAGGHPVTANLSILPGCDHQFRSCAEHGALASRVCFSNP